MFLYFFQGGPVMWIILTISIYGLGLFIERMFYLQSIKIDSKLLLSDVKNMIKKGEIDLAKDTMRRVKGPIPEILSSGLKSMNKNIDSIKEAMSQAGDVQMRSVEGNSKHLAIIANVTPLLGLLGTVTGMIIAFNSIATKGLGNPNIVADGISTALITTAYGLMVALPAILAYNYIDGRIETVKCECEDRVNEFLTTVEEMEI